MKSFKVVSTVTCAVVLSGAIAYRLTPGIVALTENTESLQALAQMPGANQAILGMKMLGAGPFAEARYRIDPKRSDLMVRAYPGGVLGFKGHDHFVRPGEFSGEVELTPGAIAPASLQLTIRAASMSETRPIFKPNEKQTINNELRDIVFEPAKYPEIVFKSTDVTGTLNKAGHYEAKIGGDLTLHGATRHIVIPADVEIEGNNLRARGDVEFNRSDYNVKATEALGGKITVRDKLKLTFDIVALKY